MLYKTGRKALAEHLALVRSHVKLTGSADKANCEFLELELDALGRKHTALTSGRILVFALLYASFLSTLSSGLPILGELAQYITYIGGILGVGILSILALYLTWRISQVWQQMLIIYGHLIAIYEKHNKTVLQKT